MAAALGAWGTALVAGRGWVGLAVSLAFCIALLGGGRRVAAGCCLLVTLSVVASPRPTTALEPGPIDTVGVMSTDVVEGRFGPWAIIEISGGPVFAEVPPGVSVLAGEFVSLRGTVRAGVGTLDASRYRGRVVVEEMEVLGSGSPLTVAGNFVRQRVETALRPFDPGRALLAGFLVGDTDHLDPVDYEAMRRAGLAHFVAVSGSNVALFLAFVGIAAGPLGIGPRRRAVLGLVALPVFAAATRFEPSVSRASLMAGIALAGRLFGIALEAWQLLSAAVIGLLALDPSLATAIGFQLSVVATAGVLAGARWPLPRGKVWRALAVGVGAQAAVAPLLIVSFGSIPLVSPLANLVAAPVVSASTVLGMAGVAGIGWLIPPASWLSSIALSLAHAVYAWPQVGALGLIAVMTGAAVAYRFRSLRGMVAVTVSLALAYAAVHPGGTVPDTGAVVLDVGQGDAILLSGGGGHLALVDGGPDSLALYGRLARYGVNHLDLVVLTHVHADHAAGLLGIVGRIPIDAVWAAPGRHRSEPASILFSRLGELGVYMRAPAVGESLRLGGLVLRVMGPLRHYAGPNDESIVISVEGPASSMLLTGDIEAIAQADLGRIPTDVLKVPHHGGATSDPDWLAAESPAVAVISVGDNDFGHPAPEVLAVFEGQRVPVRRTDLDGDIVIDLAREVRDWP